MEKKYGKPPCIFKIDISSTRYDALLQRFDPNDMKIIDYYYFDLSLSQSEASLYQKGIRLRVNNKGRKFSLELKDRSKKPYQEIKQKINLMQFSNLTKGVLPLGPVATRLNLDQRLYLVRTITVFRIKKCFSKGILVLEKSVSAGHVTWQLEFRSCYQYLSAELYQMKKKLGVASKNNRSFTPKIIKVWDRTKLVQAIVI
ncbi:MAG: hypothetical protein ACLFNO_03595 [Parcubacteria group bacterium]